METSINLPHKYRTCVNMYRITSTPPHIQSIDNQQLSVACRNVRRPLGLRAALLRPYRC